MAERNRDVDSDDRVYTSHGIRKPIVKDSTDITFGSRWNHGDLIMRMAVMMDLLGFWVKLS